MGRMLNQVLAIEKDVKSKAQQAMTALHKTCKDGKFFSGFIKTYQPFDENGDKQPDERVPIQAYINDVLKELFDSQAELINVVAMKDVANTIAKADVVVDNSVLMANVPATHLLWLDHVMTDLHTFLFALPELDPGKEWVDDPQNPGVFKTGEIFSYRTFKTPIPVVKIEPGPHSEGEAEIVYQDRNIGRYTTVIRSAAITRAKKKELLDRLSKIHKAIRSAREKANIVEIEDSKFGMAVVEYIMTGEVK